MFSSHVLSDVEAVADRAALLVNGKLVAIDRPQALDRILRRAASPRLVVARPDDRDLRMAVHL